MFPAELCVDDASDFLQNITKCLKTLDRTGSRASHPLDSPPVRAGNTRFCWGFLVYADDMPYLPNELKIRE